MLAGLLIAACLPVWLDGEAAARDLLRWALNAGPLLLLWLLLLVATARPWLAGLGAAGFGGLFYLVNGLKLANLGLPLLPSDLLMAGQLLSSPELYFRYVGLGWLALGLLVAAALAWAAWRERPLPRLRIRYRLPLAALLLAGASLLGSPQALGWSPYASGAARTSIWHPAHAARELGAMALFVKLLPNTHIGLPEPDPQQLMSFRETHAAALQGGDDAALPDPLPDIVVVQSESFFDARRIAGLQALPLLSGIDALSSSGDGGLLRVPTYGGLTTRTEFEFLTGFPLGELPSLSYPFQGLVHRPLPSLAWSLRELGYRTIAVHPYEPRFYQRHRVYPLLGFEAFHDQSSFHAAPRDGYYLSDAALMAHLQALAEQPGPQFLFAVSMENHGPWDHGRPTPEDAAKLPLPDALGADDAASLQRFLHHLANADRSLVAFARWMQQREEPTLLLFYGDHLPALDGVYGKLGFVDGQPAHQQPTDWLLLDNRRQAGERRELGSHQLAALLLQRAGLHHDAYFHALSVALEAGAEGQAAHLALASEQLGQAPRAALQASPAEEAQLAEVADWGPADLESRYPGADEVPGIWLHARQPLAAGTRLTLGGRRLEIVHRTERFLLARPAHYHFGSADQLLPLRLVSAGGSRQQTIGEIRLRPAARRVPAEDGSESRFCAVEDWGPQETALAEPANLQPNGNMGIWLRAECLPPQTRLEVAGQLLNTTLQGRLATSSIALAPLKEHASLPVSLVDASTGARLQVGNIRWLPER